MIDWTDFLLNTSYDFYFGTENPPPLYQSDLSQSQFVLNNLSYNTIYYWYVIGKNVCGETVGQKWNFKTCSLLNLFNNLSPPNLSVNQPLNYLIIDWDDVEGATSYNLYFGITSPPQLYISNIKNSNYIISGLEPGTTYYWYVVAKNNCDEKIGDEWSFKTCNNLPLNFNNLVPENNEVNVLVRNVLLD